MLRHMEREEPQGEENGEPMLQCQMQQAVASAAARYILIGILVRKYLVVQNNVREAETSRTVYSGPSVQYNLNIFKRESLPTEISFECNVSIVQAVIIDGRVGGCGGTYPGVPARGPCCTAAAAAATTAATHAPTHRGGWWDGVQSSRRSTSHPLPTGIRFIKKCHVSSYLTHPQFRANLKCFPRICN